MTVSGSARRRTWQTVGSRADYEEKRKKRVQLVAERCRALGALTPFQFSSLIERSVIEDPKELPSAREMVEDLASDHERVAHRMHALIEMAGDRNDPVTDDLCTARSAFHEKAGWMLRSIAAE